MAPAISNAEEIAQQFRAERIPAACINSMQSPAEIARLLDAFRAGRIWVLTHVDMVGEGFDLPACKCLIIATRTGSFPRYRQWCGRVLRPENSGEPAVIIDLTGMCAAHGLPDEPVQWDLLTPPCGPLTKRKVPCNKCGGYFDLKREYCPHCGAPNRWLDGESCFAPGSFHFDIRVLDPRYVSMAMQDRRRRKEEQRLQTELLSPSYSFGGDAVGRAMNNLSGWFPKQLKAAGIPVYDINTFIQSDEARDHKFWMKHFTANDLRSNNQAKAVRVYKKWLKQRSSSATRATSIARPT